MRRLVRAVIVADALLLAVPAHANDARLFDGELRGSIAASARAPKGDGLPGISQAKPAALAPKGADPLPVGGIASLSDTAMLAPVSGLRGALEASLESSDALRASLAEARATDYRVFQKLASFTPAITAELGHTFSDGISTMDGSTVGVGLRLPLFTSGQRMFDVRAARSAAAAADFRALSVRDDVTLQTVEAYLQNVYAVRAAQEVQRQYKGLRRLVGSLNARHASGFSSGADIAQAVSEMKATEQRFVELESERVKSQTKLASLADRPIKVQQSFPQLEALLSPGRDKLLAAALRRNPRMLASAHAADAARESSRSAVARYLPQVSLTGNYSYGLDGSVVERARERWSVGITLTTPIVDLTTVGAIGEAKQMAAAERYRAQDTRRSVERDFLVLWEDYDASIEREALASEKEQQLKKVLASAEARYDKGLIDLDLLLDARRDVMETAIEIAQLRVQKSLSAVEVLVAAGLFKPSMLGI